MKNTFEEYKKAILATYEIAKTGENSHYLLDPTPANLKKMAAELCASLSAKDEQAFAVFFDFKTDTENKGKAVLLSDTDKFRPLSRFLKSRTNLQDSVAANIVAILVGYEHRPFVRFREATTLKMPQPAVAEDFSRKSVDLTPTIQLEEKRSNAIIIVMLLAIMALSAFAINKSFEKKCMVWKEDHYEKIACEPDEKQAFVQDTYLEPVNDEKLEYFKKIKVNDSTVFFKNGQPIVWYVKQNNRCEFFSAPGVHPISKKALRAVTPYIVSKYYFKKHIGGH